MPTYSPAIRVKADALTSLPVKRYSCVVVLPRRTCSVDAVTAEGARLVGAFRLNVTPDRVVVVETARRLAGSRSA